MATRAPRAFAQQDSSHPPRPVLIAEDNPINRAVAEALLARRGLKSEIAHNGREALEMATARDYSAIFMDCHMPELDGYEATRKIRASETDRHVPIIALTALSMPGDRDRCLAAGMDDYLAKPIRDADLQRVIARWLGRSDPPPAGANGSAQPPGRGAAHPPGDVPLLDEGVLAQLRESLSAEQLPLLLDALEAQVRVSVGEIEQAVGRGDLLQVREVAHRLKGSAASFGAARLQALCLHLEHSGRVADAVPGDTELSQLRACAAETLAALREWM
jgi:CheY-like chemotaxis protein/HPt (histidine-containing phosphotransfer) domain-containing protein